MTTLEKRDRLTLPDLMWSTWPFSSLALEFPVRDVMTMRVEEFVDGDEMVVRAELPGIDPDKDVEISMAEGFLTIAAERREEHAEGEQGKPGYRTEFRYGSFRRLVRMPEGVREADVKATYHDGILEIRMPMVAVTAEPSRIPVSRA